MNNKRKRKINAKTILGVLLCIILILIIIGLVYFYFHPEKKDNLIEKLPTVTATPTPVPTPKVQIVDETSKTRPIAVMIDNNAGNNNHAGLLDAYLTYEIIVEGGLSRIMAVFKDTNTELIGPVRSSRHYFLDYALENGAIYGHYGWSTFAEKDISALKVNNINGMTNGESAYWRDKKIAAPHNVFTSIEKLKNQATKLGYPLTGNQELLFDYSAESLDFSSKEEKQVANSITTKYSYSQTRSYAYQPETKMYLRNMNGKAHLDKQSKEQLSYKNIIIQQISNYTLDSVGHQDIRNIGTGNGYFITEGYAIPIQWKKDSRTGQTTYTYLDGKEIVLNDGRTFIQIVPTNQQITIS